MRLRGAAGRLLLVSALAVGGLGVWRAGPATAGVAPTKTGYWMEAQSSASPRRLPAPPFVPAGGLYVANSPDGPKAISAVTYAVNDVVSATLELRVFTYTAGADPPPSPVKPPTQPPSANAALARISACAVHAPWLAPDGGGPGAWEQRPRHETDCVRGQFSTDGSKVIFDLGRERQVSEGLFDLAIVPDPTAAPEHDAPFSITFDPPRQESLVPGEADDPEKPPQAPEAPEPADEDSPAEVMQVDLSPFGEATLSVALPAAPFGIDVPTTTSTSPPQVGLPPSRTRAVARSLPTDRRSVRVMAVALLLALGLWWSWVGGQWKAVSRLLGATARPDPSASQDAEPVDGIGRFARPRSDRPRPLV